MSRVSAYGVAKLVFAPLFLLVGSCATQTLPMQDWSAAHVFKLEGCPTAVTVTVPKEFVRAPSAKVAAENKACRYSLWEKAGSYECLLPDWAPETMLPRIEVKAWDNFSPHYTPGELDERTWNAVRAALGGRPNPAADRRQIEFIRRFEPSAPADDLTLRERYAQFFYDSSDTAPRTFSSIGLTDSYLIGGRYFYVHRCIISIQFFVAYPSEHPMTTLNGYMERMAIK